MSMSTLQTEHLLDFFSYLMGEQEFDFDLNKCIHNQLINPSRDDIELDSGQCLGMCHSASSVDIMLEETC